MASGLHAQLLLLAAQEAERSGHRTGGGAARRGLLRSAFTHVPTMGGEAGPDSGA